MIRRQPRPAPFPYTTLFRSGAEKDVRVAQGGTTRGPTTSELAVAPVAAGASTCHGRHGGHGELGSRGPPGRSEEHTSELQSSRDVVFRLLLDEKKVNMSQTL